MHPVDFDRAFARQRNDDLRREVATHRLARRLRDSRRGSRPQVPGTGRGHGRVLSLMMALLSLLVALAHQTWAAQPACAQEQAYTLSVSVPAGGGRVMGPGIDCGAGETECSQGYDGEFRRVCEPDPDTGRPVCFQDWSPSAPTLTANTPHDWRSAGWGGACAGTGVTCAVVMDADKPISAA
jgi:hypothetical protein